MESHSIAIPHTEFEHVHHSGFAIAINHAKIKFYRSDEPQQTINPDLIIMMAIAPDCEKVMIIQSLFSLLTKQQMVQYICRSQPDTIQKIFTDNVKTR